MYGTADRKGQLWRNQGAGRTGHDHSASGLEKESQAIEDIQVQPLPGIALKLHRPVMGDLLSDRQFHSLGVECPCGPGGILLFWGACRG